MPQIHTPTGVAPAGFRPAPRVHEALTAAAEKLALQWMARRAPGWLTSDQLTVLGLVSQVGAGLCYALARYHRLALLGVIVCIVGNWLGDSLDGTLARIRDQQRPRYGFYVDHMVDLFGAVPGGVLGFEEVFWADDFAFKEGGQGGVVVG